MEQEQKQEQEHGSFILELPSGTITQKDRRSHHERRGYKGKAKKALPARQFKSTTHEERFVHVKDLPIESKYGAATVFARKEPNSCIVIPGKLIDGWYASVAFCWKTDQFSREQGRQNARRLYFRTNAKLKPYYVGEDFNYEIAEALVAKVLKKMFNH